MHTSQPVLIIGNAGNCRQSAQGQGDLDINPGFFKQDPLFKSYIDLRDQGMWG